jgi:molybdopterin synthase catalytic subunit
VVRLQRDPIDLLPLMSGLAGADDGAVALFVGVVRRTSAGRRVLRLEYEAYGEMAEREMLALERQALERFPVTSVVIVHRIGMLEIGEASVAVAVAAAHRDAAFDACRFVIDTLKVQVPIWKREHGEDGAVWLEGPGR